ncbi:MAG: hypothetical protein ACREVG_16235 [Burkholderiales bacterium]
MLVYDLPDGSGKPRWSMSITGRSLHRMFGTEKPFVALTEDLRADPGSRWLELLEVGDQPRNVGRYQMRSFFSRLVRVVESRGLAVVSHVPEGREIYDLSASGTEPIARNVLAISASGRYVAIRSDAEIEIRDMNTRMRVAGIRHGPDETDRIERIVFSGNDAWMGAIGNKGLAVYRVPDATLFVALPLQQASDVIFAPQGEYMLVKSGELNEYDVFPLRPESIRSAVGRKLSKSAANEISACLDRKNAEACKRLGLPDQISNQPER